MEQHKPTVDDKAPTLNQALIDGLKHEGHIRSPRVEAAFRAVRRHLFPPGVPLEQVYTDQALPAKQDEDGEWLSSSSQPAIMAIMLEQLDLQPVEHDVVPPLIGLGGKWQTTFTFALFEEYGLAALMRPPGQRAPLIDIDALFAFSAPFALFVRQFSPDESPAQRLIAQVRAWDAAGRPSSDRLHVRAYRKDQDYTPTAGEILVEKQWAYLVLDWPAAVS